MAFNIYFDTETYFNYKGLVMPYLIGWTTDEDPNKFEYSFEPHTEFFKMLEHYSIKYGIFNLWAHNANYDLSIIYVNYLMDLPHKNKDRNWQVSESETLIKFEYIGKENNKICFRAYDTYNWKRGSLADWIIDLKLKELKGCIDYDKNEFCELRGDKFFYLHSDGNEASSSLSEELAYLKIDVLTLPKILARIYEQKLKILNVLEIKLSSDPKTAPAFGKNVLNALMGGNYYNNIYQKTYKPIISDEMESITRNSVIGGFTAYNKDIIEINSNKEIVKTYDINSFYPWIMHTGLPAGQLYTEKKRGQNYLTIYLCQVEEAEWKEENNYFSRVVFPDRYFKAPVFMYEVYLKQMQEVANIKVKIIQSFFIKYGVQPELRGLINKVFEIKSNKNNDKVTREAAKLVMNSQFGKFLEKNYCVDYFFDSDKKEFIEHEPKEVRDKYSNLTGLFIVQLAQSILLHHVTEEHKRGNTFIYCDTDSIKMIEKHKPLFTIGENLGEWKEEGSFNIYRNNKKAKKYLLWNTINKSEKNAPQIKVSGISNKNQGIMKEKFSLEDWLVLFDINNNILIKAAKTAAYKNEFGHRVIRDCDVEFNKGIKITHICDLRKEKDYLIKVNEE